MKIKNFTNTPEIKEFYSYMDEQESAITKVTNILSRELFFNNNQGTIFELIIAKDDSCKIIEHSTDEVIGEIYYNEITDKIDFWGDNIRCSFILLTRTIISYNNKQPNVVKKHKDSELWFFFKKPISKVLL